MIRFGATGRLVSGLVLVLAAIAGIALFGWRSQAQLAASTAEAQATQRALTLLAALLSSVTDAEAGQRGFSLTGDAGFLEPYAGARTAAESQLVDLRALLAGNAELYSRLVSLGPLIAQRFDALAAAVDSRRRAGGGAQGLAAATEGKRLQDRVRAAVAELQRRVQVELAALQSRSRAAAERVQTALALAAAAPALLAAGGTLLLRRDRRLLRRATDERRAGERREQRLGFELQRLLSLSPDAVCVFDAEGRFKQASPACEVLWGCSADGLRGTPYAERVVAEDQARMRAGWARTVGGKPALDWRHRTRRADGSEIAVSWTAAWSAEDETLMAFVRDVSASERGRRDIARQAEALRLGTAELLRAQTRAEAAESLQARFMATVNAALRTPLHAIIGHVGIVQQGLAGPLSADQDKQLATVRDHARQLLATVNDVLDLARLQAGILEVANEPFDLWETVQKAAAAARPRIQAKGLLWKLQIDGDLGLALGDARCVLLVLGKLLDNALHATESGSVTLKAATGAAGLLRVAVIDTGRGIADGDMPQLFTPFRPLAGSAGAGLGLALARGLARAMGGDIEVATTPGQCSTFALTLPAVDPGPTPQEPAVA